MLADILDIVSANKELAPQLIAIVVSVYTLFHINTANNNIKMLFSILDEVKERVSDNEEDLEILHDSVYKHYMLTHQEARKYLHYHNGCKTTGI